MTWNSTLHLQIRESEYKFICPWISSIKCLAACDVRGSRRRINYFQSRSKTVAVTFKDDSEVEKLVLTTTTTTTKKKATMILKFTSTHSGIIRTFYCLSLLSVFRVGTEKKKRRVRKYYVFFLYLCDSVAVTSNFKRLRWQISNIGHWRQGNPYYFHASVTVFRNGEEIQTTTTS